MTDKLKKHVYKDNLGGTWGYYIGYTSIYSNTISPTESEAIRNAMKKLGGFDVISEVRFDLNCRDFTKKNAFYKSDIGEINNFNYDRPVYIKIFSGKYAGNKYLLSKDGRKIKILRN